ncbi:MAG TPA: DinB family protein [Candidatus Limnocylindria bacterium]|nr:DinB family protein [Candidatus Limnocylindria bacterium]
MRDIRTAPALPGYPPELGAALWRLEDARSRTLELLTSMPSDYVDRPARGNSIGTILYHVALIEADWLYSEILEEAPPTVIEQLLPADHRDGAGVLTLVRGQTLEQHLARLRTVRGSLLTRLRDLDDEDYHRPRNLPEYDVSPAWVLHHLAQHEAEHRGELGFVIDFHATNSSHPTSGSGERP